MANKNRVLTFIVSFVLISLSIFLYFNEFVLNLWNNTTTGVGNAYFYKISASVDGNISAIGRREDDYVIANGTLEGNTSSVIIKKDDFPENFKIKSYYAVSKSCSLAAGYHFDNDGNVISLSIYSITNKGKNIDLIFSEECFGDDPYQQELSVKIGAFSHYDNTVNFVIWKNNICYCYSLDDVSLNPSISNSFECNAFENGLILFDGKIAVIKKNGILSIFSSHGVHKYDVSVSKNSYDLFAGMDTFYCYDQETFSLKELSEIDDEYYLLQTIPINNNLPMTVQPGGTALWLSDNQVYRYEGSAIEVKNLLYGPRWKSGAILAGILLAVIFVSLLITTVLCGKIQISMLIRSGIVYASAIIIVYCLLNYYIVPYGYQISYSMVQQNVESAASLGVRLSPERNGIDGNYSSASMIGQALSDAGLPNASVFLLRYVDDGLEVLDGTDTTYEKGSIIKGDGLLLSAKYVGTISIVGESLNGVQCTTVAAIDDYLIYVQVELSSYKSESKDEISVFINAMMKMEFLFVAILSLLILRILNGVSKITKGIEQITIGKLDTRIKNPSGDELEGLSIAINNMTEVIEDSLTENAKLKSVYTRFVPTDIIKLFNVNDLSEVDNTTHTTQNMIVLTLAFGSIEVEGKNQFSYELMNKFISKLIIMARTYNGIIKDITRDRCHILFNVNDLDQTFKFIYSLERSIYSANQQRAANGWTTISYSIALDIGFVNVALVGDDETLYTVSVSKSLQINEELLSMSKKMDCNVLFTQKVKDLVNNVEYRYVGETFVDNKPIELYEYYEGNQYLLAQRKRDTKEDFNKAIEAFYNKDYKLSKRILLELARTGSNKDGMVRYYLNLSDKYEQENED